MIIVMAQTLTSPVQSMKPTLKSLLKTGWQALIIDYFLLNIDYCLFWDCVAVPATAKRRRGHLVDSRRSGLSPADLGAGWQLTIFYALLKRLDFLVEVSRFMIYENEKKNDQIASSTGQSSVAHSQRLSAGVLSSILTQALHATSIVRHSGIAAISKNRLSRHHSNAQGLLRSAQSPWTQEDTALFHSMLCRTKAAKKRAFEKLLASIFKCAEAIAMLDEPPEAAIDSTGLETRHVSRHFVHCTKRPSYFRRFMIYENEKKNDQIASSTGQSSVAHSQRLSAGVLSSILTQALHATSIVRHSGIAAISKNRLSRHHSNAQGLLRSAQSPWTQEDTALFHSMLCRTKAAKKRAFEKLLASIFKCAEAIAMLDEPPEAAIDSTGLETRHVSRHFVHCTKRPSYFRRNWPKMTIVCDTHTHLIAGCIVTRGPSYDFPLFEKAMRQASKQLRFARILADSGYDSEANHRFGREVLGIHTIIALNARGSTKTPTTVYRAEMKHQFDKKTFNRRWQVESVFSQHKRLLGSALRNRSDISRERECLLRILTHNLMIIRRAA